MAGRTSEDQADPPTVLVVEDEVLIRMSTADYLRGCGYHIIEVGSGDEAVAVLKADVRIDVVFTDVSMPGNLKWLRPCPVGAQRTTRREGDPDLRSYQNRQGSPGSLCAWPARGEAVRAQRSGPAHPGTSPAPLIAALDIVADALTIFPQLLAGAMFPVTASVCRELSAAARIIPLYGCVSADPENQRRVQWPGAKRRHVTASKRFKTISRRLAPT
jgi:hypothetical protein